MLQEPGASLGWLMLVAFGGFVLIDVITIGPSVLSLINISPTNLLDPGSTRLIQHIHHAFVHGLFIGPDVDSHFVVLIVELLEVRKNFFFRNFLLFEVEIT